MEKLTSIPSSRTLVSIIIPANTFNVVGALNSIFRLCSYHNQFEVIVVLNNCDQDIGDRIKGKFQKEIITRHLKIFYISKSTIGKARNKGIEEAVGRYIVHMDSDCELTEDYLSKLFLATKKDFLLARGNVIFLGANNFLDRANCFLKNLVYHNRKKISYTPNLIANINLHKNGFIFDDKNMHGEDTELSMRLEEAGIVPIYFQEVSLIHRDKTGVVSIIKKYFHYGIARAYRYKKWQKTGKYWEFYRKLFGEIPNLKRAPIKIRTGILLLYILRDLGVLYGLIKWFVI